MMDSGSRTRVELLLRDAEDVRRYPYDDKTGAPPPVKGKLTIGVGRNLTDRGISDATVTLLLDEDLDLVETELARLWPWTARLDPVRYAVMVELLFNMGATTLKAFVPTLALIESGAFAAAADRLARTKWASDVKARRADRVTSMLRSGRWPGGVGD